MDRIEAFYAVTATSVYKLEAVGKSAAAMTKLACDGVSGVPVNRRFGGSDGDMVAVGSWLFLYRPEEGERRLEEVQMDNWSVRTSPVVALFKDETAAKNCLSTGSDRKPCDPRWLSSTKEVLSLIGEDHPAFYIPRTEHFALAV